MGILSNSIKLLNSRHHRMFLPSSCLISNEILSFDCCRNWKLLNYTSIITVINLQKMHFSKQSTGIFLISTQKHMLWVFIEIALARWFKQIPSTCFCGVFVFGDHFLNKNMWLHTGNASVKWEFCNYPKYWGRQTWVNSVHPD